MGAAAAYTLSPAPGADGRDGMTRSMWTAAAAVLVFAVGSGKAVAEQAGIEKPAR
jgi:hypothetical protein